MVFVNKKKLIDRLSDGRLMLLPRDMLLQWSSGAFVITK